MHTMWKSDYKCLTQQIPSLSLGSSDLHGYCQIDKYYILGFGSDVQLHFHVRVGKKIKKVKKDNFFFLWKFNDLY